MRGSALYERTFLLLASLAALSMRLCAQAAPPLRTDDPGTPGDGHWEINVGFLGDRSPSDGDYQVPDLDLNYGWGDRIQLKYELPAHANGILFVGESRYSSVEAENSWPTDGLPRAHEATLGLGGRQALNWQKSLILLFMGGRSFNLRP